MVPQFRVNATTAGNQSAPARRRTVLMGPSPGFLIAWQSEGPGRSAGSRGHGHLRAAVRQRPERDGTVLSDATASPAGRGVPGQHVCDGQPVSARTSRTSGTSVSSSPGRARIRTARAGRRRAKVQRARRRLHEGRHGSERRRLEPERRARGRRARESPRPGATRRNLRVLRFPYRAASNLTGPPGPTYTIDDAPPTTARSASPHPGLPRASGRTATR